MNDTAQRDSKIYHTFFLLIFVLLPTTLLS